MKLWSYGVGKDRAWATLSTANRTPYVEIQGGPVGDQSIKLELQPKETRWHVEFWIPSNKALDIYTLKVPNVELRLVSEVPLFDWAREEKRNDGSFTMAPGWPAEEKGGKLSKYCLRVAWGSRRPCWRGCSNWK